MTERRAVVFGLFAAGLIAAPAAAAEIRGPLEATFVSCYDGDTCRFEVVIWPGLTVHTAVRLRGVDAPEIRGQCDEEKAQAAAARDFVSERLEAAERITLLDVEPGKYAGRVVADLVIDGVHVAELLIAEGLARPYDGGKRAGWCAAA